MTTNTTRAIFLYLRVDAQRERAHKAQVRANELLNELQEKIKELTSEERKEYQSKVKALEGVNEV